VAAEPEQSANVGWKVGAWCDLFTLTLDRPFE